MEVLADIVTADAIGGADLGDEGGEEGADEAGGEEEEEDPNEFVHVDEKFYYLVNIFNLKMSQLLLNRLSSTNRFYFSVLKFA